MAENVLTLAFFLIFLPIFIENYVPFQKMDNLSYTKAFFMLFSSFESYKVAFFTYVTGF